MEHQHNGYNIFLTADDPLASTPDGVTTPLKPHQKAGLYKAIQLERTGNARYFIENPEDHLRSHHHYRNYHALRGDVDIKTNVGIIGDIVGHGKTLLALSIIVANPSRNIFRDPRVIRSVNAHNISLFSASMVRQTQDDSYIHTTLVVVPRGPVYVQWETAIRTQTTLRVLALDSLPTIRKVMPPNTSTPGEVKQFLEGFDVVLVKNTTFPTLIGHYPNLPNVFGAWDRVMIDEAHDIIGKTPLVRFHFLWLISATYSSLTHAGYGSRTNMLYGVRDLFIEEYMNLMLIKSTLEFVTQSFAIPPPVEHFYMCQFNRRLAAVQPFLTQSVQDRLNANDIRGAISELGGTLDTENDIVELVTKEIKRDLHNKEIELNMLNTMMFSDEQRTTRTASLTADIQRLNDKLASLVERVTMLEEKACPICFDTYTNPIMLECTHVFCGGCLIQWMRSGRVCPQCRVPIQAKQLHAIVSQEELATSSTTIHHEPKVMLSKEDQVIDIIKSKPDGKFLVFSRIDAAFWSIMEKLRSKNISYVEMKGSTNQMMKALNQFNEGGVKVILLSTYHAGSGIDISCATDVILLHSMGIERDQAVGRAQRQGRTVQLHIHSLLYPHEAA